MRPRSTSLTGQELEIMKIVWERGSTTVRDVYEKLLETRKVAYTTVMTMMKILEQKKYLKKTLVDRAHVYRPVQPKKKVIGAMVRDFVNRVFNGSAEPLLVHLVEEHNLSKQDLEEIAKLREEAMTVPLAVNDILIWSLQIGFLVAVAAAVPSVLRLKLPNAKLAYWQLVLVACLLLPVMRAWKQEVIVGTVTVSTAIVSVAPIPATTRSVSLRPADLFLGLIAAGIAIRLGLLLTGFWRLRRHRRHSRPLEPASSWGAEADLHVSGEIASPVTFGFRRPVILLPASFSALGEALQEGILCHEVLHVRRGDWLFTVGEEFVRAVFWFHPAIWWLLGEIQLVREQAVDREVVEMTKSRDHYVDALLVIAGAARLDVAPAPLFLRKRHLKQRVFSIFKEVQMSRPKSISALAAGIGLLAASCWFVTSALSLQAAPQVVVDGPGVAVDTGGAQLMHRTPVGYPSEAIAKGVQGTVLVQVKLDGAGNVSDESVVGGPEELRRAVLQSVLNWHFTRDTAFSTRQISIAFQLPLGVLARSTPHASPTVLKRITVSALSDEQQTRLLAQLPVHEGDTLDPDKLRNLSQVIGAFGERLAYIVGDDGTLTIRGGGGSWVSTDPRLQGPDQPIILKSIVIKGLSDQQRDELLAQLPVHEGDTLTPGTLRDTTQAMLSVARVVHRFDEHLSVRMSGNSGAMTLIISTPENRTGAMPPPPPPPPPSSDDSIAPAQSGSQPIRIGAGVAITNLLSQTPPVDPPLARAAGVQGTVRFDATIGTDGHVKNLRLVGGPPLLVQAAMQAVKDWVYKPVLLQGNPVEVLTAIDVDFTLSQ